MTDLLTVLPDFDHSPFAHILPSLERACIHTADLLTLGALDVAKRARVPRLEVVKLQDTLIKVLHDPIIATNKGRPDTASGLRPQERRAAVTTLDGDLDAALNGGVASGQLTEFVGESATGKTQLLLTLLLSAQLSAPDLSGSPPCQHAAIYISTESALQTTRLTQILETHPRLVGLPPAQRPTLERIFSIQVHDLEAQEHILRYQVPVIMQRHKIGLIVIDSIAANFRVADFDKRRGGRTGGSGFNNERNRELALLGELLRRIARTHDIPVVMANQVGDRFIPDTSLSGRLPTQSTQNSRHGSQPMLPEPPTSTSQAAVAFLSPDPLSMDHQLNFFTGWGDEPHDLSSPSTLNQKNPALGLPWANQISTRVALFRVPVYENKDHAPGEERNIISWNRVCKVVFSAYSKPQPVPYEIWQGGIRSLITAQRLAEQDERSAT